MIKQGYKTTADESVISDEDVIYRRGIMYLSTLTMDGSMGRSCLMDSSIECTQTGKESVGLTAMMAVVFASRRLESFGPIVIHLLLFKSKR